MIKAKELLVEIIKEYPDVVAIARDRDENIPEGAVYIFFDDIPTVREGYWMNINDTCLEFGFPKIIEWDSDDWRLNIVTINDLQ